MLGGHSFRAAARRCCSRAAPRIQGERRTVQYSTTGRCTKAIGWASSTLGCRAVCCFPSPAALTDATSSPTAPTASRCCCCCCCRRLPALLLLLLRLTTRAIGTLATDRARLRPRRLLAEPKGADRGCIDVRATGVCCCCCCCCRSALAHGARRLLLRPRRAKLPAATAAGSVVVGRAQRAPKRGLAATHACHTSAGRQLRHQAGNNGIKDSVGKSTPLEHW